MACYIYIKNIGDGDSSVHSGIHHNVPGWGPAVKNGRVCKSHCVNCYQSHLEKSSKTTKRTLNGSVMKRLTAGAHCAIKMYSVTGNIAQLRHNLRQGPNQVFNDHRLCNPAFCGVKQKVVLIIILQILYLIIYVPRM